MQSPRPILFVDFDGTICHDRYWRSLPTDSHEKVQELLFRNDKSLVSDWMRGKYTAEEINQFVAEKIGMSFEKLWRVFIDDCKTMNVSQNVLETLSVLRNKYVVILMTGNMDSFSRFTVPALHLEQYFDYISNSYHEGKHKTDNEGEIFVEYAEKYGVPIARCAVIDDSENVCSVFEELGGIAYRITLEQNISHHLTVLEK